MLAQKPVVGAKGALSTCWAGMSEEQQPRQSMGGLIGTFSSDQAWIKPYEIGDGKASLLLLPP